MKIKVKSLDNKTYIIRKYLENNGIEEFEIEAKDMQEAINEALEYYNIEVEEKQYQA